MKLLVDTQCWLWIKSQPDRFSRSSRELMMESSTELLLSVASAWEIATKYRLGKLRLPERPSEYVPSRLRETQTLPLPISVEHALRVGDLPLHHRDPFDRVIIAQAQIEKLSVMTVDPLFALYDVDIIAP